MGEILSYILLGVSLSAPIGPINAAQLDKGMKYGFLNAWMVGLGAMFADVFYMALIYFGLSQVLTLPGVKIALWIAGSIILMYIGIETLRGIRNLDLRSHMAGESAGKSFISGCLMALTNPLNFMFWFGIYGSLLARATQRHSGHLVFTHSLGIFIGIFIWDIVMAVLSSTFHKYANRRVLQTISAIAGLSLIGFASYFAFQAHQAIF